MRRHALDWYVFGAQAVVAYGQPRMTADIDITVAAQTVPAPALIDILEEHGFSLRAQLDETFLQSTRLLPLVHRSTLMPTDVVLSSSSLQSEFMARRKQVDIQGVHVPLISPEDLVVTKVLAGRRKDLGDVRGILDLQLDTLDMDYIRALLSELSLALCDPRLLSRFERLARGHKLSR